MATLAGWVLSAVGCLNPFGYVTFAGVVILVLYFTRRFLFSGGAGGGGAQPKAFKRFAGRKFACRFRRSLPLGFLILAILAFLGGALYPPGNYTGLSYRTPRVLQWLAHDHWFWIHTPNYRMNNRACGFEWLTAPVLLFTRSDRLLFLLNYIPFLLLPGLIFSVFTRSGIRPRVAWCWMWLLPTGYTFLLQAGSVANDTFPAVYALAAIDFAYRAQISKKPADAGLSLLAAALLTGAKASNLPLLLPWIILFLPLFRLLLQRPASLIGMTVIGACVSFLPTAILNQIHCGDWSGLNLERPGMDLKNALVGLWANPLLLGLNNLVPPVFPLSNWWNRSALSITPGFLSRPLQANFENGFHQLPELQTEDWAGLGFGLTCLAGISFLYCLRSPRVGYCDKRHNLVLVAPWVALMVFCMKSGMVTGARLIAPYYPLLLVMLLQGNCQSHLVRKRWWRYLALGTLWIALPILIMTPGRPLWPVRLILSKMQEGHVMPGMVSRAAKVYTVYFDRPDPLANVRASIPVGERVIGFMADGDDLDISFWRPFGTRSVSHVLLSDSGSRIRENQIKYIAVGGANLVANGVSLDDWLQRAGAQVVATNTAILKVSEGLQLWYTVKMNE